MSDLDSNKTNNSPQHLWAGTLLALLAIISYTAAFFGYEKHQSESLGDLLPEYLLTIAFFLIMSLVILVTSRNQRRSEKALQNIEEKYHYLVEQAADPIITLSALGAIVDANSAVQKISGFTPEELKRKHFLTTNILVGESMSIASREFLCLLRGDLRPPFELTMMHKNGTIFITEAHARKIQNALGEIYIQVIFREITTRKQAELSLLVEKNKAQSYLNVAGVIILAINRDETVSLINRTGCEIFGYPETEIVGQNWFEKFLPQERINIAKAKFNNIISTKLEPDTKTENLILTKSGEKRLIVWHHTLLRDENGEITGVLRSGQDITDQRKIEEQLHLQSTALEAASNGIVITDRNGKIVWANPAITQLSGYSLAELIGQNPRIQKSGLHNTDFYENLWNTVLSGNIWQGEIINRRRDDRLYTEEMTITPVRNKDGEIRHFIAIKRDITERKRLQQSIEQANIELEANAHKLEKMLEEMAQKNQLLQETQNQLLQSEKLAAIGVLSSGIAHEIKNPLAIISLSVEEFEAVADKLDNQSKMHLQMIKRAADRANNVIIELLRFARVSDLRVENINLHNLIEGTFTLVQNNTKFKGVSLILDCTDKTIEVIGDRILLEQAIFNLLMNSIDALERQGKVTVKTYLRKSYSSSADTQEAVIDIIDNGSGIDPEVLPRIFEPFFTTKEQGKGTGLGLSTVYTILKRHQGTINVESKVGEGSTFTVTLPLALKPQV